MIKRWTRRAIRKLVYAQGSPVVRGRIKRMEDMVSMVRIPPKARVIDLGGTGSIWSLFDHDFDVTLVNLRFSEEAVRKWSRFKCVEGDACDLRDVFEDDSFDVVFSNSVIEHVGPEDRQEKFAEEARRLGRAYWVQTPSIRSWVEPHSLCPFYWQVRARFGRELIFKNRTRVLTRSRMQDLFPEGTLYLERTPLFEKSYAFFKPVEQEPPPSR